MRTMNYRLMAFTLAAAIVSAGCSDTVNQGGGGTVANSGTVSQKNFSILFSEVDPTIIDPNTGIFTKTDIEVTAFIGDRNNQQLTDPHQIFFESEYGLIEPSCTTDSTGSCTVTWSAITRPVAGGPGSDGFTTIVAYTAGEEAFTDNNGNGLFDDNDVGTFVDQDEPYIDLDLRSGTAGDGIFDGNDVLIDTRNGNDLTGINGVHDIADGFFNGGGCTHSTLCSTVMPSPVIWIAKANSIVGSPAYTVGGNVSGLTGTVVLQNNGADDLSITANGGFTFTTSVDDGATYGVTVLTQPAGQTCAVTGGDNADGTGTINGGAVNSIVVTCTTNTFTVGGNVTGTAFPGGTSITIQNNGADDIVIPDTGPFAFTFPAQNDLTGYAVTENNAANTTGLTCVVTGGGNNDGTGTLAGANITNIDIACN